MKLGGTDGEKLARVEVEEEIEQAERKDAWVICVMGIKSQGRRIMIQQRRYLMIEEILLLIWIQMRKRKL